MKRCDKRKKRRVSNKVRRRQNLLKGRMHLAYTVKVKNIAPLSHMPPRFHSLPDAAALVRFLNHNVRARTPCFWRDGSRQGYLIHAELTDIGEVWAKFVPVEPYHEVLDAQF